MKKILVISDTHSHIDNTILKYIKETDEVWHAGDIGNIEILDEIKKVCKYRAVFGNIDDNSVRSFLSETKSFYCEKIKICMIHIAGKPPYYNLKTKKLINIEKPRILIYGHSHILKVNHDKKNNLLCINPGAAGRHGFHHKRTMVRFEINQSSIENMEIIELGERSRLPESI